MKILKIKRLSEKAMMPTRAHRHDAGLDFYASSMKIDYVKNQVTYGTDISCFIEPDYAGKMYMRSSVKNKNQFLNNAVGVIDAGYVGEITFVYNIPDNNLISIARFLRSLLHSMKLFLKIDANDTYINNLNSFIKHQKEKQSNIYRPGDKIGQMLIERVYYPEVIEVDELPETERGINGYGSSDK